jgi:hypothetical protein
MLLLATYSGRQGGAAFGARYFTFLVPLGAAALAFLFKRSGPWGRAVLGTVLGAAAALNLGMLALFRREVLPHLGRADPGDMFRGAFTLGLADIRGFWDADRQNVSLLGGGLAALKIHGDPAPLGVALLALSFIACAGAALATFLVRWLAEGSPGLGAAAWAWVFAGLMLVPAGYRAGALLPAQALFDGDLGLDPGEERTFEARGAPRAARLSLVVGEREGGGPPDPGKIRVGVSGDRGSWVGTLGELRPRPAQWMATLAPTHAPTTRIGYVLRRPLPMNPGRVDRVVLRNLSAGDGLWVRAIALD